MVFTTSSQNSLSKASTNASGVYIGLGSNLSFQNLSPEEIILEAMTLMTQSGDCVISRSSFWITKAWPRDVSRPDYINSVCCIEPHDRDPFALLQRLLRIEVDFGRKRDSANQWASRTLDLDLLDYHGLITQDNATLILPHPRSRDRDFVLLPLLEIAPDWRDPVSGDLGCDLLKSLISAGSLNDCMKLDVDSATY
jgi:2-amino-4-hydroxy-6-hydroxymethyldihydropteridine diphosphokinase